MANYITDIWHQKNDMGEIVVRLEKQGHIWQFTCPECESDELFLAVIRLAKKPNVQFDWLDAAVVIREIKHHESAFILSDEMEMPLSTPQTQQERPLRERI